MSVAADDSSGSRGRGAIEIARTDSRDDVFIQDELRALSDGYKRIAGYSLEEVATASAQPTSSDLFGDKRAGC